MCNTIKKHILQNDRNEIKFFQPQFKPLYSGSIPNFYYDGANQVAAGDNTPRTMTVANGKSVSFEYPQMIKSQLAKLIDREKQTAQDLFNMQRNNGGGGIQDITKMMLYGMSQKIERGTLVPPILPLVKTYETACGLLLAKAMINTPNNVPLEIKSNDSLQNGFVPTSYSLLYGTTPTALSTANVGGTSIATPRIYAQWISFKDYMAFSVSPQLMLQPFASYDQMVAAEYSHAHVFVPIVKSLCKNMDTVLFFALGFTGFNTSVNVDGANATAIQPMFVFNGYSLPTGSIFQDNIRKFFITFVEIGDPTNAPLTNDVVPITQNAFVDTTRRTEDVVGNMYINHDRLNSALSLVRWLAGSQFPRVVFHAANKMFRFKPIWKDHLTQEVVSFDHFDDGMISQFNVRTKTRHSLIEYQVPVVVATGFTPTANESTMSLPYNTADVCLWAIGINNISKTSMFGASQYYSLAFLTFAGAVDRLTCQQLTTKTFIDYPQAWNATELNLLFKYAELLYPEDRFLSEIFMPDQPVYSLGAFGKRNLYNNLATHFSKFYHGPLYLSDKAIQLFQPENDSATKVMEINDEYNTTFGALGRAHWYAPEVVKIRDSDSTFLLSHFITMNTLRTRWPSVISPKDDTLFTPRQPETKLGNYTQDYWWGGIITASNTKSQDELILTKGKQVKIQTQSQFFLGKLEDLD